MTTGCKALEIREKCLRVDGGFTTFYFLQEIYKLSLKWIILYIAVSILSSMFKVKNYVNNNFQAKFIRKISAVRVALKDTIKYHKELCLVRWFCMSWYCSNAYTVYVILMVPLFLHNLFMFLWSHLSATPSAYQ